MTQDPRIQKIIESLNEVQENLVASANLNRDFLRLLNFLNELMDGDYGDWNTEGKRELEYVVGSLRNKYRVKYGYDFPVDEERTDERN